MKWLVLIVLFASCQQGGVMPNSCGVNDPLSELSWLKEIAQDPFTSSIIQGTYQRQTVYAVNGCIGCFAGPSVALYRCDGSVICSGLVIDKSSATCTQIISNLTDKQTLFEQNP